MSAARRFAERLPLVGHVGYFFFFAFLFLLPVCLLVQNARYDTKGKQILIFEILLRCL
jgi:hypothetical protein